MSTFFAEKLPVIQKQIPKKLTYNMRRAKENGSVTVPRLLPHNISRIAI